MAKSWLDNLRDYAGKKKQSDDSKPESPVVGATDYTAVKSSGTGVPVNAQWRDGKVSVGGILVNPEYVEDGKAFVRQEDIDNAINQVKQTTGIKSGQEILDKYQKYADRYDKILDKMENRGPFSYDADSDPVYQAYQTQYNREGRRSTEDTMGIYSGLTGGMANSSAVTAAAQAGQYWNDKLMDVIPELAEGAYDRYVQEFEMDRKALADIMSVDTHLFDREYGVNRDTLQDFVDNQKSAQDRDDRVNQMNWEKEKTNQEMEYKKNKDEQELGYKRDELDYKKEHGQEELAYQREKEERDRQEREENERWERAYKLFESTGKVSNEQISEVLGIPQGAVTSQMKRFVEEWMRQKEELKIKHDYTMAEINQRKQK